MFDKIFGNFEERREEIQQKLSQIELETEVGNGAVVVKGNAKREILDISIDQTKIDVTEIAHLEDLILNAVNELIKMATEAEAEESKNLLKDMLPPGMGGLANMFS